MDHHTEFMRRMRDLSDRAARQCLYAHSEFLTTAQQDVLLGCSRSLEEFSLWGGAEICERRIAVFGGEAEIGYPFIPPIACIEIAPRSEKFATQVSHRDFLGALMNLGIRREVLGDIFVTGSTGVVFCLDHIANFIIDNLDQVGRTSVDCKLLASPPEALAVRYSRERVNVASERADALVSAVWNLSRGVSGELLRTGKIYVNSRLCEDGSKILSPGDAVSARGFGKFVYRGAAGTSKKGRLFAEVDRMI